MERRSARGDGIAVTDTYLQVSSSTLFSDGLLNNVGQELFAHTSDTGQGYFPIVIGGATIDPSTLSLTANGIPQGSSANAGGALVEGFALPATFVLSGSFTYNAATANGIGLLINYDISDNTALLLNFEPGGTAVHLYKVSYTSGAEFTFTSIASATVTMNTGATYPFVFSYSAGVVTVTYNGSGLSALNYTDSYTTGHLLGLRASNTTGAANNCTISALVIEA